MKLVRALILLALISLSTTSARAQLGLYGAPEPLQPMQMQPVADTAGWQAASYVQPAQPAANMGGVAQPQRPWYPTSAELPPPPRLPAVPRPGMPTPGPSAFGDMVPEPAGPAAYGGNGGCNGCNDCDVPGLGSCGGRGCCSCGEPSCACWYGSVTALFMTRDRPNKLWTTYDWADEARQIPTFGDYDGGWGGEVTIGRRFCCGCAPWAIELTYWGLDGPDSYSNPGDAAALYGTPFNLSATGGLQIRGIPATAWFDGSPSHRVWRKDEVHDVEVNLVRNQLVGGPCQRWNVDWLVGFRFFKFRDHLVFGAENAGTGEWAYLDDHVRNYLWGPQTGVNVDYRFAERWRAFVRPVIGAFYNHSTIDYDIHAGADHATQTAYPSIQYPVSASGDHLSFLTQIDFGLGWQITPRLELKGGYRVVALTGMALAESQVPFYAVDTEAVADIDHNGTLVLHGAFFGATYNF